MAVAHDQRFTRSNPCPICGGFDTMPRGRDKRCAGFVSQDGKWAFCQREPNGAHHEVPNSSPPTWAHLLRDEPFNRLKSVTPLRRLEVVERELRALEERSEAATSAEQYEADRQEYDRLWAEVQAIKTATTTPENPHPGIEWIGLRKLFEPLPEIDWLNEYLKLAQGPCACFAGYGYSGKTAIIQYLLLCLAFGKPLFGIYPCQPLSVGWMDYEQGFFQSAGRLQRQARGLGIDLEQLETPDTALRYAEYPDVYLSEKDTKATDTIARAVEGMRVCLLDSARAITPGVDENDSKIRIPFDALSRVTKQTGCQFIVVHHYGKGDAKNPKPLKERMRGSSALFDAMATVWGLERRPKETFTRVELAKDRWTNQENIQFGVRFEDGNSIDGASWVKLHHLDPEQMKGQRPYDALKETILAAVKEEPGLSGNGLYARLRGNRPAFIEALRELRESHKLSTDANGGYRAV